MIAKWIAGTVKLYRQDESTGLFCIEQFTQWVEHRRWVNLEWRPKKDGAYKILGNNYRFENGEWRQ